MWSFIVKGGYLMYPLIFCSVLSLAVIIERAISLSRSTLFRAPFLERIKEFLSRGKILEAVEFCEKHNSPLSRVIKVGLLHHDRSRENIKEAMEIQISEEIPQLEKFLGILATLSAVSPLLGLLGTVSGMVRVFSAIEEAGGQVDPGTLAGGIWEALLTTVLGLLVAIPSLIAYNYFTSRLRSIVGEMELASGNLLDIMETLEISEE